MEKITIVKQYRGKETLRVAELAQVAQQIEQGEYKKEVGEMRDVYLLWEAMRQTDDMGAGKPAYRDKVPRMCVASVMENLKGERIRRAYTGLVLLEVNHLGSAEEARAVCQGTRLLPQTMLAFVGASGRSVKIVCKGELADGSLPTVEEDIRRFHLNLYEKARLAYNMQLGVTIDKREPSLEQSCHLSYDPQLVFNPAPIPFYTDASPLEQALKPLKPVKNGDVEVVPGHNLEHASHLIFEYNLSKAWDDTIGVENEADRRLMVIHLLAEYCQKTGLDMADAQHHALYIPQLRMEKDVVLKAFENAYREENETRYLQRMGMGRFTQNIPQETLTTMKVDMFLNSNYEIRKNVMRGVAEYRQKTGLGFSFQDLTEEARNSITMRAKAQGIKCWDRDIKRYVESGDIQLYDPVYDFLESLPQWDGKDRVEELANRVPTSYGDWQYLFHIWMRSMVAMWRGKGQLTGNALVPLLIGRQGTGKSSFCRILLPREMREYYNDRINFKNDRDLNLGLTSFALINLDEFDSVTQRQQIVLKYLLSTADLKYRPPYGKAYSSHRRYASFIGTTNEQMPLTDPTGSRRFVCVPVEGSIDFESYIDYPQLYAQLKHEVDVLGLRYYLTKDEEQALMEHNQQFQKIDGLGEMLLTILDRPLSDDDTSDGEWLTISQISDLLRQHFRTAYKPDGNTLVKIGRFLNRPEYRFTSRHTRNGQAYWVKRR